MFPELDRLAEADRFEEMIHAARAALERADAADAADLHHYLSWAHFQLGLLEEALEHALAADDPLDAAKAYFHLWRFEEAGTALADAGDLAEAHWYRALVAEFTGQPFAEPLSRAIELEPDRYRQPVRLGSHAVEAVVTQALAALPAELVPLAQETVVEVRPLPAPHADVDPLTLGLYVGESIAERNHLVGVQLPPKIEIYRSNIERFAQDREEAEHEVRITLLHELGHHFGFDEEDMARLGLE